MLNPFRILRLLVHVRRPSRIDVMRIFADGFWLRKGYEAMTFFGTIVIADEVNGQRSMVNGQCSTVNGQCSTVNGQCSTVNGQCSTVNSQCSTVNGQCSTVNGQCSTVNDDLVRHETIHLRQAQSTHDSWLLFYLLYFWYILRALPQNCRMKNAAYRINPFELEAYLHMYDHDYLEQCKEKGATEWRTYARMSPRERLKKFYQV